MTITAQPKVSVLISTFNRPAYLREAIESVVKQSFADWELLIMNDGGVDVADVVKQFNDRRLRYFPDNINHGAAYRFNFGLDHARGQYITYLGDDDLFYPNHLEVLSKALDDHPEIALAYSDLYAVSCVKDEGTGQRYVLDKRIAVSRDFNRDFMFYYNHVLHVSLMHRREAAFRVGCFDETVKVLIEWSLNRRLCFIFDFLHVPVVTGEYYMPLFKSDRISVVQRKDKDSYRHNLRKIRANLPPEPWPKIDKVEIIWPVTKWDSNVGDRVGEIVDEIDHPIRIVLVNNGSGMNEDECWAALGKIAELRNISIITPPSPLDELSAYRFAARKSTAKYIYLFTEKTQLKAVPKRVFGGLAFMKNAGCEGVKFDLPEEMASKFDLLIDRKIFLKRSDLNRRNTKVDIQIINNMPIKSMKFDILFGQVQRLFSKGKNQEAFEAIKATIAVGKGAPGIQFLVHLLVKICLAIKEYDFAEKEVRALLDRGYEPDNWIRLGLLLQRRNQFREAIDAYQKGLAAYNLSEKDLDRPVFPFNFPKECTAFTALIGQAECYDELKDMPAADHFYRLAAKLRANSHRPFLGFAKHFLATKELDKAEAVLSRLAERDGKNDPETHRVLGKLCYLRGNLELAFNCYRIAFEKGKADEKNIDPLFSAGRSLNKWAEIRPIFEEFLELCPGHLKGMARLAEVCFQLGEYQKAEELSRRGLSLDNKNVAFRGISQKCLQAIETADRPRILTAANAN